MSNLKYLMAPAFLMATEAALASGAGMDHPIQPTQITEVAVYSVKDGASYEKAHQDALGYVSQMPGFLDDIALKNQDGSLYADILFWNSLDDAVAAAKQFESQDQFAPMRNGIQDLTIFRHYQASYDKEKFDQFHAADMFIEIAASQMKSQEVQASASPAVYAALQDQPGFKAHIDMSPVGEDKKSHIDFISWSSVESAKEAGERIMGNPENTAFFQNAEKMELFEFFTKWGNRFAQ